MAKETILLATNSKPLSAFPLEHSDGSLKIITLLICDTEADLPTPAWGSFAVVKAEDPQGRHYFYVGIPGGWKRAELEPIDD